MERLGKGESGGQIKTQTNNGNNLSFENGRK
jgi:hypothetical protein